MNPCFVPRVKPCPMCSGATMVLISTTGMWEGSSVYHGT